MNKTEPADPAPAPQWSIRSADPTDRDEIWQLLHEAIRPGDTYALPPNINRDDALALWFAPGTRTYVLQSDSRVIGTYILKSNQQGGGDHVANAAFVVAGRARGCGAGRAMADHCFAEARRLGFRAMQFNFVVSTNGSAIKVWQDLGMKIVGTLPRAFRHPGKGYVDVYVMYRSLAES